MQTVVEMSTHCVVCPYMRFLQLSLCVAPFEDIEYSDGIVEKRGRVLCGNMRVKEE